MIEGLVLVLLGLASAQNPDTSNCHVTEELGCYADSEDHRILPYFANGGPYTPSGRMPGKYDGHMTHELCAEYCCGDGQSDPAGMPPPGSAVVGVEFGSQCWCGKSFNVSLPKTTGCSIQCTGNHSQTCGGSDAIFVYRATCKQPCQKSPPPPGPTPPPSPSGPNFYGCIDNVSQALPYCDITKTFEERVADIMGRLTIVDKITLLSPTESPYCACHTAPIPSIGLPRYKWLTETNSAVDTNCVDQTHCSTVFVGPTGIAASFNRTSWWLKGDVVSTDLRVLNNIGFSDIGLTGFGPNINIVKDPRYGRNSELPGEDPFLSGQYASAYVQGCQQVSTKSGDKPFPKMNAYLKHYTAYNVESSRFTFSANVSQYDFWDTYLPQYEAAFIEGQASGAMCSYMAPNGVSSCGNNWLLNEVIREQWNRPDAVIMSDCSAVANMAKNIMHLNDTMAAAQAMNAGLDVYGGWNDHLWGDGHLAAAVNESLTNEATISKAVERTLMQKMKVGLFDPPEGNPWRGLTLDDMNSTHAQQVAYEAALQSFVLLKNNQSALPLKLGAKIAVVGPLADTASEYISDYAVAEQPNDTPSIADAIYRLNAKHGGNTTRATGVDIKSKNNDGIAAALALVDAADATVLVLGITKAQEHEGIDRSDTLLPGLQSSFAQQVFAAAKGKPVVLVMISGGIVSIDELIDPAPAIVDAFNPALYGPAALADTLFGIENRWGKLPVTIYPGNYSSMQPIQEMSLTSGPGRSYRYYNGTALFSFGEGLSYTDFNLTCTETSTTSNTLNFSCSVANIGKVAGDEVVQVFHSVSDNIRKSVNHPVPLKRLIDFDRVSLAAGATATISFGFPTSRLSLTNSSGASVLYPGQHTVTFTRGHGTDVSIPIAV